VVDAQLAFETDASGKVAAVVLHQNGIDQRAPRIEGEPIVPKEITLASEVLDRYVGGYQLVPGVAITIARQEARLFAQVTGQGQAEIFASGEREFFYKVVNAQITFEVDGQGRAVALVLHQFGRDLRAPRNP
jgi:serine-type D-Ala-D-Ala carboxypeptidase/endopeptidase